MPERVELQFGPGHGEPVALELPGGRTVIFKGYADRVDVAADGLAPSSTTRPVASGASTTMTATPLPGRKLQLPVYGSAARTRLGDVPIHVAYWFISEKGNFKQIRYVLDPPPWSDSRRW